MAPQTDFGHWNNSSSPSLDDDVSSVSSGNSSDPHSHLNDSFRQLTVKYATTVFFLVTFLFGIVGNTLTIYVIVRNAAIRNKSVSNYYILNLAAADELYVATLPFFCYTTFTNDWIFGEVACKLAYVFRESNKWASVLTLMALSIDRFLATYHNSTRFRQIRVGIALCAIIWVVSLAVNSPYLIYSHSVPGPDGRHSCRTLSMKQLPTRAIRGSWVYGQLTFGMIIPLAVIGTFNVLLLKRLRRIARSAADRNGHSRSRMNSSMFRLVLAIVIIFMACQLPYHIMEIQSLHFFEMYTAKNTVPSAAAANNFIYSNSIAQILVFISSCCNPIVYGIFNKNYRNLYLQVLCCRTGSTQNNCRQSNMGAVLVVSRRGTRLSIDHTVEGGEGGGGGAGGPGKGCWSTVGCGRCVLSRCCCCLGYNSAAAAADSTTAPVTRISIRSSL